ncbi:MAG: hypothetical protein IJF23_03860 [Clostridia bacterium]|nr:hypothetical protein [Clostridia bacterium]
MLDIWVGDTNIAPYIWIFILIILFPCQLALCFKVRKIVIRLLPAVILFILTVSSLIAMATGTGWEVLLYLIYSVYLSIALLVCGIAWATWAIVRKIRKKEQIKLVKTENKEAGL